MLWDIFWPLMSSPSTQYQCHRLLVQEAGHKGKKWVDTAAPLSRKVLKRFQTSERQTWHLSDRRRSDCTESKLGLKRSWHWSQICDTNNETLVEELHHVKANSSVRLQNALAEQAETFPASSHPPRTFSTSPVMSEAEDWFLSELQVEDVHREGHIEGFLHGFPVGEHNGPVLNRQTQSTLRGVAWRHVQSMNSPVQSSPTPVEDWNPVTTLCFSSCFYCMERYIFPCRYSSQSESCVQFSPLCSEKSTNYTHYFWNGTIPTDQKAITPSLYAAMFGLEKATKCRSSRWPYGQLIFEDGFFRTKNLPNIILPMVIW